MFDIDLISSKPNRAKEWLEILKNTDKPVIIFTAGTTGQGRYQLLTKHGVKISCFADNSEKKVGTNLVMDGKPVEVIGFQDILNSYPDAYVVITSRINRQEILKQFITARYNIDNLIAVDFSICDLNIREHIVSNYEQYQKAYGLFSDERSKDVFINKINFLSTGEDQFIDLILEDGSMYFDSDITNLSGKEIVIDGGGYIGDTCMEFIKAAKTFEHYYLCEPDPENMRAAQSNLSEYSGIKFVPMGLWSGRDRLTFSARGTGSSRLSDFGITQVEVTSIDEILDGGPATFIKMDIEGAETEALRGAVKTIQKYKPKLAICVYHKVGDFIDIPLLIHKLNPEYVLYLRHYSVGRTDTVCYAV